MTIAGERSRPDARGRWSNEVVRPKQSSEHLKADSAGGENKKNFVPTDKAGAPVGNKQFLNNTITKYAGMVLDLGKVKIPKPKDDC